jgi:predicted nucleotidyltransferase
MKAQDFVRATTAYHDELMPNAWNGSEMKPEVRARLIEIAQLFVEYLDVPGFDVYDIVLTGSLANYNWTEFSDFDLHVVTDYRDLQCDDLAEAFYRAKKTIWNDRHDITIYGHEVELYVEDINEPPVSGGVFSVVNGEWIKTPNHQNPNINDTAIVRKVQELQDQIERSIATADDPEDLKRLTDKLRNMRQAGLADGGEFSVENLAFKTLRNMGIIKALHDAYTDKQDSAMTLGENTP